MNLGFLGLGKLGCTMLGVYAEAGHSVFGYDVVDSVNKKLAAGIAPVSETGIQELISSARNNISVCTSSLEVLRNSEIVFVIVPTPSREDGSFSLDYIKSAVTSLVNADFDCSNKTIVVTSTVLPGDMHNHIIPIARSLNTPFSKVNFCYSPEFIALGSVIHNLKNPDFLLIGEENVISSESVLAAQLSIVSNKEIPLRRMSISSAELAKISINAYVTMKLSFANAIGMTADNIKACSAKDVLEAIGSDIRIGEKYFSKGLGFGGPCFPRDNRALQTVIDANLIQYTLPTKVDKFNRTIPLHYSRKIYESLQKERCDALVIVGITYKDGSHVLEESQAYSLALECSRYVTTYYFDNDALDVPNIKPFDQVSAESLHGSKVLKVIATRNHSKIEALNEILDCNGITSRTINIWSD